MKCSVSILTPSCVDVETVEEEVLDGGPDPERHLVPLPVEHPAYRI